MGRIEDYADHYRGYLADERSLAPVAGVLATSVAMWLLVYLVSLVGPAPAASTAAARDAAAPVGWTQHAVAR